MCLAVPGKIIQIIENPPELKMAKVSFAGIIKEICIEWLPNAKPDDYILAHAGIALNLIDQEEARLTLKTIREWQASPEEDEQNNPAL